MISNLNSKYNEKNDKSGCVIDLYVNFTDCDSDINVSKHRRHRHHKTRMRNNNNNNNNNNFEANKHIIETYEYDIWTKLQFIWTTRDHDKWTILANMFDLDCCQCGFDGNNVLCSYAFIQSINTQSMINYKLTNNAAMRNNFLPRTQKYYQRGFDLLVPKKFVYIYCIFLSILYVCSFVIRTVYFDYMY